ncbi:hypothetical protein CKO35_10225 [Ectothiorhodospira shaposhnikovii]|uniref:DUF3325 domain-containing protein n=1 Tax=Ectothiorhodospira shaposhnikovii TaxID=1054 RepID=UPI001908C31F|nr:DUF3325 domain-containing protein [Ectothiorhodospira shaposhnikovii]MBK1673677.1 hypothetical protein [Ectothiorhodospira shaposhnikovii]
MMPAFALFFSYSGLVALALAMDRHHRQIWQRPPSPRARRLLNMVGMTGLGVSFALSVAHAGWSVGPALWLGLLSLTALVIVLLLSYRPRYLVPSSLLACIREATGESEG